MDLLGHFIFYCVMSSRSFLFYIFLYNYANYVPPYFVNLFSLICRTSSLLRCRECLSMILQMRARLRGRFGEGGPRCRRRKRREKGARSRVSADESLSAVSGDLDKLTRMLGTCLSPVSRVNFASLYAISLSLSSSSPFLVSSPMHRYRGSAAPLSTALNGYSFVDPSRSGWGEGTGR